MEIRLERILCPLDFSEFSARAFDYAQSLARHYQGSLLIEHVVQPVLSAYPAYVNPEMVEKVAQGLRDYAEDELREFIKRHSHNGMKVESLLREGEVTDTILATAEARAIDLIVMGTHGRHGLDRWLLGSVTEKVLRKARCPVLAVRKPVHGFVSPEDRPDPVHLCRLVVGVDFSACSERAVRYAVSLAGEYDAELTLLHILEDFPPSKDLPTVTAEAVHQLEGLLPQAERTACAVKTRLRVGKPYEEIVRCARELDADLIVTGVRGRNALDLALFGSTTHRVIEQGPCPVLAVHL
jgi:nucleotide-binding universal stress UspA family protein